MQEQKTYSIVEIIKNIQKSFSYTEYRTLIQDLLNEKKSTGVNQSEDLYNYSLLNEKRMTRLDKTIKIEDETIAKLKNIKTPQKWIVISEGWCGDAAQNLPVIAKMAATNSKIEMKIVLRDDNLKLMDMFLTNGGRAIPKLIVLNENDEVIASWGPRPSVATKMVTDYKNKHGKIDAEIKKELQVWYNKNKGKNLQEDIISII